MSRDAEQFAEATSKLHSIEIESEGTYLHKYEAVLAETDESVQIITLAPELADNDAATDAFSRITGQWYNANTHPNIVSIVERATTPRPWIAIDQPHELTLDRVQSQLTSTELETVVTDTAEALRTLGLYNAVHGTLSPDDILVFPDGDDTTVYVGTFGLTHAVRTALGESKPTPYTAPELLNNPNQPTEETDVYGLGAITYFALTGQPPVDGASLEQAIRNGPIAPPSEYNDEISLALDDVVMQALSTYPDDRYASSYTFSRVFSSTFDSNEARPNDTIEKHDDEAETATSSKSDEVTSDKNTNYSSSGDDISADTDIIAEIRGVSSGELKSGVDENHLQCTSNKIIFVDDNTVETEILHTAITDIDTEIDQSVEGFRRIGNAFLMSGILLTIFSLYLSTGAASLINDLKYLFYAATILSILTALYFRQFPNSKVTRMSVTTSKNNYDFFGENASDQFNQMVGYIQGISKTSPAQSDDERY